MSKERELLERALQAIEWHCDGCTDLTQDIRKYLTPEVKPSGEVLPQRVVCAAIRHKVSGHIICSARHFDPLMHSQIAKGGDYWRDADQGFIDQRGNFLSREEALAIAKEQNQILRRCGGDEKKLFSENLY